MASTTYESGGGGETICTNRHTRFSFEIRQDSYQTFDSVTLKENFANEMVD